MEGVPNLVLHWPIPEVGVLEEKEVELASVNNKLMWREWILTTMTTIVGLLLHH